jgi:hypothetical protein
MRVKYFPEVGDKVAIAREPGVLTIIATESNGVCFLWKSPKGHEGLAETSEVACYLDRKAVRE